MRSAEHQTNQKINCMKCAHYYVTWEPQHPRGCRAYGFKSRQMPSVVVKASSGSACLQFTPKQR